MPKNCEYDSVTVHCGSQGSSDWNNSPAAPHQNWISLLIL